jgi:hypothetical protein
LFPGSFGGEHGSIPLATGSSRSADFAVVASGGAALLLPPKM